MENNIYQLNQTDHLSFNIGVYSLGRHACQFRCKLNCILEFFDE